MTWPADERAAETTPAERLFERYLLRHDDPGHPAFGRLCAEHPGEADELQQLARDWTAMAHMVDTLGTRLDGETPAPSRTESSPQALPPTVQLPGSDDDDNDSQRMLDLVGRLSTEGSGWRRYRVRREIDRGGMGRILRVWDGSLRRPLAMKVMLQGTHPSTSGDGSANHRHLSRFLDEAQITGQLDHPGIVPVHELGLDEHGHLFFTMRLVRGRSLREVFELLREGREAWSLPRVLGVLLKVCEALAFAHSKGVVHRDIKPGNVMVGRFGETYVMDWGLAKVMGQPDHRDLRPADATADLTRSDVHTDRTELGRLTPNSPLVTMDGTAVGTPAYMSPEQAAGRSDELGPRSDVYSVGALLYELVTGCMPYVGDGRHVSPHSVLAAVRAGPPTPIEKLAPEVAPELCAICEKAMAREPGDRYADMGEMAEELRDYLEGRVVASYEAGTWAELRKWIGRNRTLSAVVVVALLALTGALGWALMERDDAIRKTLAEGAALSAAREAAEAARVAEQQAVDNAVAAVEAQRSAEEAGRREATAAASTRTSSYMASIGAAEGHLNHRELDAAARLLDACPPELRGWEWSLLERQRDSSLARLDDHTDEVLDVAFGPGGRTLASVSRDGTARIWDTDGPALRRTLSIDDGSLDALALHPDGRTLAVAVRLWGQSSEVRLFDMASGEFLRTLRLAGTERRAILDLVFDPAGHNIYAATDAGRIAYWPLDSGTPRAFLRLHSAAITSLAFDRSGRRLLSGSSDQSAIVWQVDSGLPDLDLPGHDTAVLAVASSPAADLVATGCADGSVHVFDLGQPERALSVLIGHAGPVTSLAFSADGTRIVSASADHSLRVWDTYEGEAIGELLGHDAAVSACAAADSGHLFASASADGSLRLWDPERAGGQRRLEGHGDPIAALSRPSAGGLLASVAHDGELRVWNLAEGLTLASRMLPGRRPGAIALSSDGSLLALAEPAEANRPGNTLALWDTTDEVAWRRPPTRIAVGDSRIDTLVFAREGLQLAGGSIDGQVRVWDASRGEQIGGHHAHGGAVQSLAFHPSEPWLASGGSDDQLVMYDLARGEVLWSRPGLGAAARALAFAPDGRRLAVARGREVLLLDSAAPGDATVLQGHQEEVLAVAWHPSQTRVASAARDGTIRVWNSDTCFALITLRPGQAAPSIAFDASGLSLVAALGRDVVAWDVGDPGPAWRRRLATLDAARLTLAGLLDKLRDPREVTAQLERDRALPPVLRRETLRLARAFGLDADTLRSSAWDTLLDGQADATRTAEALRRARAAQALRPTDGRTMAVLGLALYRSGDPRGAVTWSERADRANLAAPRYPRSRDLYVLAMAHRALASPGLARTYLEAAEAELLAPEAATDPASLALRAEAVRGAAP